MISFLVCTALIAALPATDDPPEWRNRRPGAPVELWNSLEGKPAPSLAPLGEWSQSDPLDWEDLRGNVILLTLWEAWSPRSDAWMQYLLELQDEHLEDGVLVVAAHSPRNVAGLRRWLDSHPLPFALAVDTDRTIERQYGIDRRPTIHVIGRDGRVRIAGANLQRADEEGTRYLDSAVDAIVAEPYEGERKRVDIRIPYDRVRYEVVRIAGERENEKEERAPLTLGPDGWPAHVEKILQAGTDLRGKPAPPLEVEHWLGEPPELDGKCLLVYFFTTTDGPALQFLTKLERIRAQFEDELAVVALSPQAPDARRPGGLPWADAVERYFEPHPDFRFAKALDGRRRMIRALEVRGFPHAILVGTDGIVRWQGYPLEVKDPLTKKLVRAFLARDAKRRAEESGDGDGGDPDKGGNGGDGGDGDAGGDGGG